MEIEVLNIFLSRHSDMNDAERVPIIKYGLGREEMQFIKTPIVAEQESC